MNDSKEAKQKKRELDLKFFCVFSEEDRSFSDTIKQVFQDYLRSNLKQHG